FVICDIAYMFFFTRRRRHTRFPRDWSSDVCSSDLKARGIDYSVHYRAEVEPVVHAVIDAARLAAGQVGELRLHVIHLADEVRREIGRASRRERACETSGGIR